MKHEKAPLTHEAELIRDYIDSQFAATRLYPDLYAQSMADSLIEAGVLVPLPPVELETAESDAYAQLDDLRLVLTDWIDLRFERATNRNKYGVADPSGGSGRQPYTVDQGMRALRL